MKFEGQVALVTGAGSGIGAAIAKALASEGASVVLCGRRQDRLQEVASSLNSRTLCVPCDVREEASIAAAVDRAVSELGRLNILVNNAGLFLPSPFPELSTELLDSVLDTNLRGPFLLCRHAWPHLVASRGQIVFVSSIAGTKGFENSSAYCASKFGLNGLAEVLSLEGNPRGIRVLSVCPGSVNTAAWDEPDHVLERMMGPEQIAELVRWLVASPRNLDFRPIVVQNFNDPFEGS